MNSVETLFAHKIITGKLGLITAHPDDDLSFGSLLEAAYTFDIEAYELIYSLGTASTKNFVQFKNPNFSVANGDRRDEGLKGAQRLGIKSVEFATGIDGLLEQQQEELAQETAEWAKARNIGTFATLGFIDHPDHIASHLIALQAAVLLRDSIPSQPVHLLTVHHNDEGNWWAYATASSIERTYNSALAHESQIPLSENHRQGWPALPLGLTMPPPIYQELQIYPLNRHASFSFLEAGAIALQHN